MKLLEEPLDIKYPIILCHGFGVIVTLLQDSHLGKLRHYYQKKGIRTFDPHVTPYAAIRTRANEWKSHIWEILKETKAVKCHLVAHSMGGLDVRMLSHDLDIKDSIASIHTVSSPHHGTILADFRSRFPSFLVKPMLKTADLVASKIHKEGLSNIEEALDQLSPTYVAETFNRDYPLVKSIPFYSYAGYAGLGTDIPIDVTLRYFNKTIFEREGRNDGFVSVKSAEFGEFVGAFPLAHQEQIGLGLKSTKKTEFYRLWDAIVERIAFEENLES